MAMVLPASWDFADYSSDLRQKLPQQFRKFGIFRASRPLFDEVQDGSVVIVGIGYGQKHETSHRREYAHRHTFVKSVANFSSYEPKAKPLKTQKIKPGKCLGEYLEVRIGGVTGQADYFLLSDADRISNKLPLSAVCPVLSRSNQLVTASVTNDAWQQLREASDRVWLFRPSKASLRSEAVQKYLKLKRVDGGCDKSRYKIKHRNPWYVTPIELDVDGFISGMSGSGPWICHNEMKNLAATNTLYTVKFRDECSRHEKFSLSLYLLTSKIQNRLKQASRIYAQGLKKLEPSDLTGVEIGIVPKCNRPISTYRKCIQLILKGKRKEASKIADAAFAVRLSEKTSTPLR